MKPIVDEHHVVRLCKNKHLIRDEHGRIKSLFPEHFHLREGETYLSAAYFEHFAGTDLDKLRGCCQSIRYPSKPKDGLVKLNAGAVKQSALEYKHKVRVFHRSSSQNPAYASIDGLPSDANSELCSALVTVALMQAVVEVSTI